MPFFQPGRHDVVRQTQRPKIEAGELGWRHEFDFRDFVAQHERAGGAKLEGDNQLVELRQWEVSENGAGETRLTADVSVAQVRAAKRTVLHTPPALLRLTAPSRESGRQRIGQLTPCRLDFRALSFVAIQG